MKKFFLLGIVFGLLFSWEPGQTQNSKRAPVSRDSLQVSLWKDIARLNNLSSEMNSLKFEREVVQDSANKILKHLRFPKEKPKKIPSRRHRQTRLDRRPCT